MTTLDVIYEDDAFLVINKPCGLLSIQDGYQLNLPHIRSLIEPQYGRCWIIHRLDKETSGVMVLARNTESHRYFNLCFQNRKIEKIYHALIFGIPEQKEFNIDLPLLINGDKKHRTVTQLLSGKKALTIIRVISSKNNISFVYAYPKTGYTHQIRAHLSSSGFPILGDRLYRNQTKTNLNSSENQIPRLALHAHSIAFFHPVTNKLQIYIANYPDDFSSLINQFT
ncbi:MAG: RluA family pseudouridine synthase [Chloroflexi bacterium]|nr:RluA family pseudouridine synthase [Chloroflexota bacterium]